MFLGFLLLQYLLGVLDAELVLSLVSNVFVVRDSCYFPDVLVPNILGGLWWTVGDHRVAKHGDSTSDITDIPQQVFI